MHRRSDGTVFPVEVSSRGAVSADGERLLLSVVRDVSERKALMEAFAKERDTLATVMANTNAQVAYLDDEFRFVLVNDAFAKGSGVDRALLIGRRAVDTVAPESSELFERVRARRSRPNRRGCHTSSRTSPSAAPPTGTGALRRSPASRGRCGGSCSPAPT